jgi:hypothetical protein
VVSGRFQRLGVPLSGDVAQDGIDLPIYLLDLTLDSIESLIHFCLQFIDLLIDTIERIIKFSPSDLSIFQVC